MNPREEERLAHARRRWMRPDATRWLRPDHHKWARPEPTWRAVSELYERKYNSEQPRVPEGSPDGGQWTSGGGGAGGTTARSELVQLAGDVPSNDT
jgi:hypothetical protein